MSKRFMFLGLLTVAGLALLAVGWQGGIHEIKETTNLTNRPPVQEAAPLEVDGKVFVKPDSTPSGNAVEVQQEKSPAEVNDVLNDNGGFFVEYRLERERSRGHQIEIAREIINNTHSDPEVRKKAQEQMYVISNNLQKELEVESLIRAKGYQDSVVFLEGKTVTVVIQARDLTQEDAIKITDLVSRSTQAQPQNIVIIPKS
ncbi:SpoIIIAH-like family protein [Desulfotomaculum sp. 1211_IL3151]|uniref:SpoIIIAH-like family protein n=1 Tax=Desulfotomaculum sp. 1211_IL3151 TaxID=3084055 RepID=UPI002FD89791